MIGGLSHVDELKEVKLTTMERRRMRGDLIETLRLSRGLEGWTPRTFVIFQPFSRGEMN